MFDILELYFTTAKLGDVNRKNQKELHDRLIKNFL